MLVPNGAASGLLSDPTGLDGFSPGKAVAGAQNVELEDVRKMTKYFEEHDIRYFFYIGGNDSADTCHIVNEQAKEVGDDVARSSAQSTPDWVHLIDAARGVLYNSASSPKESPGP